MERNGGLVKYAWVLKHKTVQRAEGWAGTIQRATARTACCKQRDHGTNKQSVARDLPKHHTDHGCSAVLSIGQTRGAESRWARSGDTGDCSYGRLGSAGRGQNEENRAAVETGTLQPSRRGVGTTGRAAMVHWYGPTRPSCFRSLFSSEFCP